MTATAKQSAELHIRPFVEGVGNSERTIIGHKDSDDLLCLTQSEYNELKRLGDGQVSVSDFLFKHLGGQDALSFKASLDLLAKLYKHDFIDPSSIDLRHKLDDLAKARKILSPNRWHQMTATLRGVLSINLLSFDQVRTTKHGSKVGHGLLHVATLALMALFPVVAVALIETSAATTQALLYELFAHPEQLLGSVIATLGFCLSLPALVQAWILAATGHKPVGLDLKLSGLTIPHLDIRDDVSFLMTRQECLRYHSFSILLPWSLAGFAWLQSNGSLTSAGGFLATGFAAAGFWALCPLVRSPLIKLCEAHIVELDLLHASNLHASRMLFRDLVQLLPRQVRSRQETLSKHDHRLDVWMAIYASAVIVWLYAAFLTTSDAAITAAPELLLNIFEFESFGSASASLLLTIGLAVAAVALAGKFVTMLGQNIYAVAGDPLVRARKNIQTYKLPRLKPSEAITRFLRDIPILSHLTDDSLQQLTKHLRFAEFKPGQVIVRQGDPGEHFYIIALGVTDIFVAARDGSQRFIDALRPGDTFGEIALLNNVTRQASIVARNDVRVLILAKQSFDRIFPEESEFRERLTDYINRSRLIQESRALSYLTPKQITGFLRKAEPVKFKEGDKIIQEGSLGDSAYIIESGIAQVVHGNAEDQTIADLKRGDLFGMIALLNDIPRTATVIAESEVSCLRIAKQDFLDLCMQNLLVGALISELSEQQLNQLHSTLKVG